MPGLMKIPGSDRFHSVGKKADELVISNRLKLFEQDPDVEIDPVTLEVIAHKLWQISDEQGQTVKKISGSPVATEANDFNVVLTDERGDVVGIGPYYLIHAANMDFMIKWTLENRSEEPGINPGDMFLNNDPWVGSLHPQDVSILSPVFVDGTLMCWTGSTIHQVDLGGINIGSWCVDADNHFSEGMAYPPIKIVDRGEIRVDVRDVYLRRTRAPALLGLDLRAHIASNNVARQRMEALVERYGAQTVHAVMKRQMNYTADRLGERLRQIPDGVWRCETYQEVSMTGDRGVHRTFLEMTKRDDRLSFDFTGTDENVGMINSTRSGAVGGVLAALLPLLCYDIPWAVGGVHRHVDFVTPVGTIVNAEFPHAVSMGSISGTWTATNAANVCIAKMLETVPELRDRLLAGCVGSWTVVALSGTDDRGEPFVTLNMDSMGGGWGARTFADGVDTGGVIGCVAGQTPNVETNEGFYPLLYLYRRQTRDAGGPGEWRGGMGATSCWIPHLAGGGDADEHPLHLVLATYGQAFPTGLGIAGGYPSNGSMFRMVRDSDIYEWFSRGRMPGDFFDLAGEVDNLPPKCETDQRARDVFEHTHAGGGGYGDPLDRDPALVLADVVKGAVSVAAADEYYGVVLAPGDTVDTDATTRRRDEIRIGRLGGTAPTRTAKHNAEPSGRLLSRNLVLDDSGEVTCRKCSHSFGLASADYESGAVVQRLPVERSNPLFIDPATYIDERMELRQFACPGCATLLDNEVIVASHESPRHVELSSPSLAID